MTIFEELEQPSISFDFHPFKRNSEGLNILKNRLKELREVKLVDERVYNSLSEETLSFCRELLGGKHLGLGLDIFSCPACAAKFFTFYASVIGISEGRDFISEVVEEDRSER